MRRTASLSVYFCFREGRVAALITDFVFHDDTRVGSALALAMAILGPLSAWALYVGLKPYGRLIAATAGRH
jgi:hypothetical protein